MEYMDYIQHLDSLTQGYMLGSNSQNPFNAVGQAALSALYRTAHDQGLTPLSAFQEALKFARGETYGNRNIRDAVKNAMQNDED